MFQRLKLALRSAVLPHVFASADGSGPAAGTGEERVSPRRCKFLQSRAEVDACTRFLERHHYLPHHLECKNFDLAMILPEVGPGNFLDMGSTDSDVLRNVGRKRLAGERHGIDLRAPALRLRGVQYSVGNLMDTGLPAGHFHYITCLSVIEHEVDYERFTREAVRLLAPGGKLFVTFDYWEPKKISKTRLYDLTWQPLDRADAERLIAEAARQGLHLVQDMDWQVTDPVIDINYYGPDPEMSYTFGLAVFEKR